MAIEYAMGKDLETGEDIKIERQATNHILHLLLTVFTAGLWLPLWIMTSVRIGGWRNSQTGSPMVKRIGKRWRG